MLAYHGNHVFKHQLIAHLPLNGPINAEWQTTNALPAWTGIMLKAARRFNENDIDEVQRTFLMAIPAGLPLDAIPVPEILTKVPVGNLTPRQCVAGLTALAKSIPQPPVNRIKEPETPDTLTPIFKHYA